MSKVEILAEQTEFLLEKQKELLAFFKGEFESLYSLLEAEQKKAEAVKAGEDLASFQNVRSMLEVHEEHSIADLEDDIGFLGEQLGAIKQIKEMPDEQQRDDLADMLLEKGNELTETKQFKTDIEGEAEEAKNGFHAMIDDVKAVLCEDGIKELETLLEAHAASESAQSEQGEEEMTEDEDCCGGEVPDCSSCGSCGLNPPAGCGNIFEGLQVEASKDEDKKATP